MVFTRKQSDWIGNCVKKLVRFNCKNSSYKWNFCVRLKNRSRLTLHHTCYAVIGSATISNSKLGKKVSSVHWSQWSPLSITRYAYFFYFSWLQLRSLMFRVQIQRSWRYENVQTFPYSCWICIHIYCMKTGRIANKSDLPQLYSYHITRP